MNSNHNNDHSGWGIKINPEQRIASAADYPAWLRRHRREDWNKPGVVVWSTDQQQVTYLRGKQALRVLAELRERDEWRQSGITLGEPAVCLRLPDAGKRRRRGKSQPTPEAPPTPPEHVLVNTIDLTGEQTQHLFAVLAAAEDDLRRLAAIEERAECEAWRQALAILFRHFRQKEVRENDVSARLVPWTFAEESQTLTCNMPPNRVTLTPTADGFFWQGCLEWQGASKQYSLFTQLSEALEWAEQEIIKATEVTGRFEAARTADDAQSAPGLHCDSWTEHLPLRNEE